MFILGILLNLKIDLTKSMMALANATFGKACIVNMHIQSCVFSCESEFSHATLFPLSLLFVVL